MTKAIVLFLIAVMAVYVVESLSDADVECSTKPGGCDPKEINPRTKRHLHCLFFPHLCMPQYVPVYYPAVGTVQGGNTYNIVNGHGENNSVIFSSG